MTRAAIVVLAAVVACGGLMGDSKPKPRAVIVQPKCPHDEHATIELVTQVEACEAQLRAVAAEPAEVRTVHVQGAPRRCADAGPKIAPVVMSQCAVGMACLDSNARLALLANLVEYEQWVKRVQDCERGDAK